MSDPISLLLEAIEARERIAEAARLTVYDENDGLVPGSGEWEAELSPLYHSPRVCRAENGEEIASAVDCYYSEHGVMEKAAISHIARNDPAAVLRRCAQDRLMVEAVRRGIAGHPEPCVNYEGQDPKDYTGWDSCERHLQWAPTTLPVGVLDYLARGYDITEEDN